MLRCCLLINMLFCSFFDLDAQTDIPAFYTNDEYYNWEILTTVTYYIRVSVFRVFRAYSSLSLTLYDLQSLFFIIKNDHNLKNWVKNYKQVFENILCSSTRIDLL